MNDRSGAPKSNFPLPLSSVTGGARKAPAPAPVATPQTATRNAAAIPGPAAPPAGPYPAARKAAGMPRAATPVATRQTATLNATGMAAKPAPFAPAARQPGYADARPAPAAVAPAGYPGTRAQLPAGYAATRAQAGAGHPGTRAQAPAGYAAPRTQPPGQQAAVARPAGQPGTHAAAKPVQPGASGPGPRAPGYAQPTVQPAPVAARSDLMATEAPRRAMAARVARQGVQDALVLAALEAIPRHLFIEPALSAQAYIDASLPIGHNQTISQPYIVARMIEAMREGGALARVLEIGTGCGYQAAVLSRVAKEVYSIERIKPLHELAKANLRPLRISNLRLQYGDGMLGLPQAAPFDGIILAAAGLEVPQALLEQLAIGARLIAPVGAQVQHLQRITRIGKTEWTSETLEACHFVPLRPGIA